MSVLSLHFLALLTGELETKVDSSVGDLEKKNGQLEERVSQFVYSPANVPEGVPSREGR
jgi:hypothetical protein|eukprot:COSAG06_NODE_12272_length_1400_cov_30.719146_2_plen_59_part_00